MIELLHSHELNESATPPIRWIWPGLLATGMITLLTSRWKAGKTTLVTVLLREMAAGGSVAGQSLAKGRAVMISEEPRQLWSERHHRLPFGPQVRFCCRPFRLRPSPAQWHEFINQLSEQPDDLIVFDPLAMFLPGAVENNAAALLNALEPLHWLTERGKAVLLVHHPRKGGPANELSPRGSGALTGFADILADLDRPPSSDCDRERRLRMTSRLGPSSLRTIRLDEDGASYSLVEPENEPDGYETAWPVLETILGDAPYRLTRDGILGDWMEDHERPSLPTLRRWLDRAVEDRRVEKTGSGRKCDPFKYALRGRDDLLPELPPLETWRTRQIETRKLALKADRAAAKLQRKAERKARRAHAEEDEMVEYEDDRGD